MKIIVIGGHLTPALSLVDFARKKGDEIVFIGRLESSKEHQRQSREKAEVENRGLVFEIVDAPKINRHQVIKSITDLPKIITAFLKARQILITHKPDVVVSFGGYLALPIALASATLSIPVVTHEQTRVLGLANQIIALFAKKIGLSWENTKGVTPSSKVVLTGNPIRSEFMIQPTKPEWFSGAKLPILYVTGGNQGSQFINQLIIKNLSELTKKYYCVHQCGWLEDFEAGSKARLTLSTEQKDRYVLRTWFSAQEVSWAMSNATLMVSRAGANTISEIIIKNTPSLLIPLPHSGGNEQYANALYLSQNRAAKVCRQSEISSENFQRLLGDVEKNSETYRANLEKIAKNQSQIPEQKIYQLLLEAYESKNQKRH